MAGTPQNNGLGSVNTLTDGATITLDLSTTANSTCASYKVTLGGNRTLNILNAVDGQIIYVAVTQDGTGTRLLSVTNAGVAALLPGGAMGLTTTAGATDLLEILYRQDLGKSIVSVVGKAYA